MSATLSSNSLSGEVLGLGSQTAEYPIANIWSWVGAVIFGVVGLGLCAMSAFAGFSAVNGEEGALLAGMCVGVFSVVMLAGAAWQTRSAIGKRGRRVVVYADGLVRLNGAKNESVRWDDIASVFQAITVHYTNGIKTSTTHAYTIYTKDNRKILFNDSVHNVEALGSSIQREVTSRLLPQYTQTYNTGGTVTFGKFTLSKAGIHNGSELLPWEQVEAVNIQRGRISVRKQGKWFGWAGQTAAQTPNLFIFLTMVDQIVGINKKK